MSNPNGNQEKLAANFRQYEYQVKDTPRFTSLDETWELVDIWPKQRGHHTIYLLVFRREMKRSPGFDPYTTQEIREALSNNNGTKDSSESEALL